MLFLVSFLSCDLKKNSPPTKDEQQSTNQVATPVNNENKDKTDQPNEIPYFKSTLEEFLEFASDADFDQIIRPIQPLKETHYKNPDFEYTIENGCVILHGNLIKGPLKIQVFEKERQITYNNIPLFIWEYTGLKSHQFESQLFKKIMAWKAQENNSNKEEDNRIKALFQGIQARANHLPSYSDETWKNFIFTELDKIDLFDKEIIFYNTEINTPNPCPNRTFPRIRINYLLGVEHKLFEFSSEYHTSWSSALEKCRQLTSQPVEIDQNQIIEQQRNAVYRHRESIEYFVGPRVDDEPYCLVATIRQVSNYPNVCDIIDALSATAKQPASTMREKYLRQTLAVKSLLHMTGIDAVQLINGIIGISEGK